LPAGLSLGASSGKISGTPTTTGGSTFTIKVTDSNGLVASRAFSLTVKAAASPTTGTGICGWIG